MNRVGPRGPRRERVAGLVPASTSSTTSRRCASARGDAARAERYRAWAATAAARARTTTAGTAPGTAAPTSTTARRWARATATSAASTRIAQAWAVISGAAPPERGDRAMAAVDEQLVAETTGSSACSTRRSTARRTTPATSRATCRACARTAASTRTRALWVVRALAELGRARRAPRNCSAMLNPITPRATTPRRRATTRRALRGRRRRLRRGPARRPRRLDLVHRLGGLDVPRRHRVPARPAHGKGAAAREALHPKAWPGFRRGTAAVIAAPSTTSKSRTPTGCAASVVSATMGAVSVPIDKAGARIVLRRDGKLHKIRITLG